MSPIIGFKRELQSHPIDPTDFGFEFAWLEGRTGTAFCRLSEADGGWNNLVLWPNGRIFGTTGEYRWRSNNNGKIHTVMILDKGNLPECFPASTHIYLKPEKDAHPLILWGEWIDPDKAKEENSNGAPLYYANEIPKAQRYPLDGDRHAFEDAAKKNKTPRLLVRRYRIASEANLPASGKALHKEQNRPSGEFVRCMGFDLLTEVEEKQDESI
jgi:hypothetical protein